MIGFEVVELGSDDDIAPGFRFEDRTGTGGQLGLSGVRI
jgi:hypothetical protein